MMDYEVSGEQNPNDNVPKNENDASKDEIDEIDVDLKESQEEIEKMDGKVFFLCKQIEEMLDVNERYKSELQYYQKKMQDQLNQVDTMDLVNIHKRIIYLEEMKDLKTDIYENEELIRILYDILNSHYKKLENLHLLRNAALKKRQEKIEAERLEEEKRQREKSAKELVYQFKLVEDYYKIDLEYQEKNCSVILLQSKVEKDNSIDVTKASTDEGVIVYFKPEEGQEQQPIKAEGEERKNILDYASKILKDKLNNKEQIASIELSTKEKELLQKEPIKPIKDNIKKPKKGKTPLENIKDKINEIKAIQGKVEKDLQKWKQLISSKENFEYKNESIGKDQEILNIQIAIENEKINEIKAEQEKKNIPSGIILDATKDEIVETKIKRCEEKITMLQNLNENYQDHKNYLKENIENLDKSLQDSKKQLEASLKQIEEKIKDAGENLKKEDIKIKTKMKEKFLGELQKLDESQKKVSLELNVDENINKNIDSSKISELVKQIDNKLKELCSSLKGTKDFKIYFKQIDLEANYKVLIDFLTKEQSNEINNQLNLPPPPKLNLKDVEENFQKIENCLKAITDNKKAKKEKIMPEKMVKQRVEKYKEQVYNLKELGSKRDEIRVEIEKLEEAKQKKLKEYAIKLQERIKHESEIQQLENDIQNNKEAKIDTTYDSLEKIKKDKPKNLDLINNLEDEIKEIKIEIEENKLKEFEISRKIVLKKIRHLLLYPKRKDLNIENLKNELKQLYQQEIIENFESAVNSQQDATSLNQQPTNGNQLEFDIKKIELEKFDGSIKNFKLKIFKEKIGLLKYKDAILDLVLKETQQMSESKQEILSLIDREVEEEINQISAELEYYGGKNALNLVSTMSQKSHTENEKDIAIKNEIATEEEIIDTTDLETKIKDCADFLKKEKSEITNSYTTDSKNKQFDNTQKQIKNLIDIFTKKIREIINLTYEKIYKEFEQKNFEVLRNMCIENAENSLTQEGAEHLIQNEKNLNRIMLEEEKIKKYGVYIDEIIQKHLDLLSFLEDKIYESIYTLFPSNKNKALEQNQKNLEKFYEDVFEQIKDFYGGDDKEVNILQSINEIKKNFKKQMQQSDPKAKNAKGGDFQTIYVTHRDNLNKKHKDLKDEIKNKVLKKVQAQIGEKWKENTFFSLYDKNFEYLKKQKEINDRKKKYENNFKNPPNENEILKEILDNQEKINTAGNDIIAKTNKKTYTKDDKDSKKFTEKLKELVDAMKKKESLLNEKAFKENFIDPAIALFKFEDVYNVDVIKNLINKIFVETVNSNSNSNNNLILQKENEFVELKKQYGKYLKDIVNKFENFKNACKGSLEKIQDICQKIQETYTKLIISKNKKITKIMNNDGLWNDFQEKKVDVITTYEKLNHMFETIKKGNLVFSTIQQLDIEYLDVASKKMKTMVEEIKETEKKIRNYEKLAIYGEIKKNISNPGFRNNVQINENKINKVLSGLRVSENELEQLKNITEKIKGEKIFSLEEDLKKYKFLDNEEAENVAGLEVERVKKEIELKASVLDIEEKANQKLTEQEMKLDQMLKDSIYTERESFYEENKEMYNKVIKKINTHIDTTLFHAKVVVQAKDSAKLKSDENDETSIMKACTSVCNVSSPVMNAVQDKKLDFIIGEVKKRIDEDYNFAKNVKGTYDLNYIINENKKLIENEKKGIDDDIKSNEDLSRSLSDKVSSKGTSNQTDKTKNLTMSVEDMYMHARLRSCKIKKKLLEDLKKKYDDALTKIDEKNLKLSNASDFGELQKDVMFTKSAQILQEKETQLNTKFQNKYNNKKNVSEIEEHEFVEILKWLLEKLKLNEIEIDKTSQEIEKSERKISSFKQFKKALLETYDIEDLDKDFLDIAFGKNGTYGKEVGFLNELEKKEQDLEGGKNKLKDQIDKKKQENSLIIWGKNENDISIVNIFKSILQKNSDKTSSTDAQQSENSYENILKNIIKDDAINIKSIEEIKEIVSSKAYDLQVKEKLIGSSMNEYYEEVYKKNGIEIVEKRIEKPLTEEIKNLEDDIDKAERELENLTLGEKIKEVPKTSATGKKEQLDEKTKFNIVKKNFKEKVQRVRMEKSLKQQMPPETAQALKTAQKSTTKTNKTNDGDETSRKPKPPITGQNDKLLTEKKPSKKTTTTGNIKPKNIGKNPSKTNLNKPLVEKIDKINKNLKDLPKKREKKEKVSKSSKFSQFNKPVKKHN